MGFFFEFLTPFTLGDHNFLISNLFLTIVCVLDVPRGGLQILFGHQKQQNPPLAIIINTLVASNVQVSWFMKFVMEFLSHILWLPIAFGSVYNLEQ
jgi:hypothetical protein